MWFCIFLNYQCLSALCALPLPISDKQICLSIKPLDTSGIAKVNTIQKSGCRGKRHLWRFYNIRLARGAYQNILKPWRWIALPGALVGEWVSISGCQTLGHNLTHCFILPWTGRLFCASYERLRVPVSPCIKQIWKSPSSGPWDDWEETNRLKCLSDSLAPSAW